jgi:hypothetical protein
LRAGQGYRLSIEWRGPSQREITGALTSLRDTERPWTYFAATPKSPWSTYDVEFRAPVDVAADQFQVLLYVGLGPQSVDIADVRVTEAAVAESLAAQPASATLADPTTFNPGPRGFSRVTATWPDESAILRLSGSLTPATAAYEMRRIVANLGSGVGLVITRDLEAGKRYRLSLPLRTRKSRLALSISMSDPGPPFAERFRRELQVVSKWETVSWIVIPEVPMPSHSQRINLCPIGMLPKPVVLEIGEPSIVPATASERGETLTIR